MEFPFSLSNLVSSELSLVDSTLRPCNKTSATLRQYTSELGQVLDSIGAASARAQGLPSIITTASRLRQSDHVIYIKCDLAAKGGKGMVIGFLKVGCKKLFTFDSSGVQHEVEPLCILDFYVHVSCQRQGAGKQLFDAMLRRENAVPDQLAIDRPSAKLTAFMSKHYSLRTTIPQVNNFVIFDGFFKYNIRRSCKKPAPISVPIEVYSPVLEEPLLRRDLDRNYRPLADVFSPSSHPMSSPGVSRVTNGQQARGDDPYQHGRSIQSSTDNPYNSSPANMSERSSRVSNDLTAAVRQATNVSHTEHNMSPSRNSTAERIFGSNSTNSVQPASGYARRYQRTNLW